MVEPTIEDSQIEVSNQRISEELRLAKAEYRLSMQEIDDDGEGADGQPARSEAM